MLEKQRSDGPITDKFSYFEESGESRVPALFVAADAGAVGLLPASRLVPFRRALVFGRHPPASVPGEATAWTVADPRVSSVHARIEETEDGYLIHDLGSTNGTLVDGVPVRGKAALHEGAVLFFGQHVAVFRTVALQDLEVVRSAQAVHFGPVPLLSPVFLAVADKLRKLATGSGELLLVGATGVGKEVYARAIHEASGRKGGFVAVNCAAIPRELAESELFGFVRGAHSQARDDKSGLIDEADGGTLFLDEVGDMAPELQAKLLRFAQDRMLTPVGGTVPRAIDARILAATNRIDSAAAIADVGLRLDLAMRLGHPIRLPALREHVEDIGVLAAHFLRNCERSLTLAALRALCLYPWPGNVRELEKILQEAVVLSRADTSIDLEHLPSRIRKLQSATA